MFCLYLGEMEPISPDPPDPPDPGPPLAKTACATATKRQHNDDDQPAPRKKLITDSETASASIQTVYTHPSIVVDGIRSYEPTDSGPFIVHVSRIESDPAAGTQIRPIKFGQFLYVNKIDNICQDGVKRVGRNKIAIMFKSASGANKFLNNPLLRTHKYEAFIPTYNVTRMGLVRGVPVDWSMDEFVESLITPGECAQILKARRMNRKVKLDGNITWEPTQTVVLTFRGQKLPTRVFSYYSSLAVETYQFPTIQCMNCCRFGHIKVQCRSKPRCYRCAQPHTGDECSIQEPSSTCLYCSAHHFATSRTCPEQDRQKSIKLIMSRDGISYQDASSQIPNVRMTYTEATKASYAPDSHSPQSVPVVPPQPHPHVQSYRKTVVHYPKPRPPLGKTYDKAAHQNIIANVPSSLPNGFALQMSQPSSPCELPQEQLLVQLLTIIINIISQNSINLPTNVAHMISQLSSLIGHNGPVSNHPMELQQSSSEDS